MISEEAQVESLSIKSGNRELELFFTTVANSGALNSYRVSLDTSSPHVGGVITLHQRFCLSCTRSINQKLLIDYFFAGTGSIKFKGVKFYNESDGFSTKDSCAYPHCHCTKRIDCAVPFQDRCDWEFCAQVIEFEFENLLHDRETGGSVPQSQFAYFMVFKTDRNCFKKSLQMHINAEKVLEQTH